VETSYAKKRKITHVFSGGDNDLSQFISKPATARSQGPRYISKQLSFTSAEILVEFSCAKTMSVNIFCFNDFVLLWRWFIKQLLFSASEVLRNFLLLHLKRNSFSGMLFTSLH